MIALLFLYKDKTIFPYLGSTHERESVGEPDMGLWYLNCWSEEFLILMSKLLHKSLKEAIKHCWRRIWSIIAADGLLSLAKRYDKLFI